MGLPVIVDIVIGLAFIYLLLSLLASEIQELIATLLQWRAKHLKDSIVNLFASDVYSNHSVEKAVQLTRQVYQHPLIRGINQESRGLISNFFRGLTWFSSRIYRFFIGKVEGEFGDQKSAPSYIPKEAFATALLEQLGTKHFVERLIEAKFSEFVESTNHKVRSLLHQDNKALEKYSAVEDKFAQIEDEFLEKKIDLESAIRSMSELLEAFLDTIDNSPENRAFENLSEWKGRFFGRREKRILSGTENTVLEEIIEPDEKRVIENAGLNPTLEEIVESIDKGSKTYHTYKERFKRYEQKRLDTVYGDLVSFENFLHGFLQGLLQEERHTVSGAAPFDMKRVDEFLTNIDQLDSQFFTLEAPDLGGDKSPKQRTRLPLSKINEIILEKLDELILALEHSVDSSHSSRGRFLGDQFPSKTGLRSSLHAFREGFAGKIYLSDLRHFLLFRETIYSQLVPLLLFFSLGLLLAVGLALVSQAGGSGWLAGALIGHQGGAVTLSLVILLPLTVFLGFKSHYTKQRRRKQQQNSPLANRKSLAGIFDDYFASDDFTHDSTPRTHEAATSDLVERTRFAQEVAERLRHLAQEPGVSSYREMKDLGHSFRRYYLRFLLENADVDLVFIPSSVKQSLAVLIRRSKNSARQAEDQILYLKAEVEAWYDRSMARASGVYRRNAKGISILIGIFIAIAINANSIHILDQLAFDQELRETMMSNAQRLAVDNIDVTGSAEEASTAQIEAQRQLDEEIRRFLDDDINLPIGWDMAVIDEEFGCGLAERASSSRDPSTWNDLFRSCLSLDPDAAPAAFFHPTAMTAIFLGRPLRGLKFLLGWLLTGIAISMGASFWFDLLSRLVKVRNTGRQIPTSLETPEADDVAAVNMISKPPK